MSIEFCVNPRWSRAKLEALVGQKVDMREMFCGTKFPEAFLFLTTISTIKSFHNVSVHSKRA
jgi:hypothetical protein